MILSQNIFSFSGFKGYFSRSVALFQQQISCAIATNLLCDSNKSLVLKTLIANDFKVVTRA
jgi:hypothetical protein